MYHSIPLSVCSPLLSALSCSIQIAWISLGFYLWLPHRRALLILRPHHFKWCRHRQGHVFKCVYIPLLLLVPFPVLSCSVYFSTVFTCFKALHSYFVASLPPLRSKGGSPLLCSLRHPIQSSALQDYAYILWSGGKRREGIVAVSTLLMRLQDTGV